MAEANKKAKKDKVSVKRALGADRTLCDCQKCDSNHFRLPRTVDDHRILYGLARPRKRGRGSEGSPVDTSYSGPSSNRSSGLHESRGSRGSLGARHSDLLNCSSPSRAPSVTLCDIYELDHDTSGASAAGSYLDSRCQSPAPGGADKTSDGGSLNANQVGVNGSDGRYTDSAVECVPRNLRVYSAPHRERSPSPEPHYYLRSNRDPTYERALTPSTIAPNSPNLLPPLDPLGYPEALYLEYWDGPHVRSPSPVPSLGDEPVPLFPVRSLSQASFRTDLDLELPVLRYISPKEDQQFYEEMLADDADLADLAPEPLEFDEPIDLDEPPSDGDGDDPNDIPPDDDDEAEARVHDGVRIPAIHDEPNIEPEDPEAELGAAFEQPSRLRNIYVRTWVESVFGGSTRNQTSRMLASHKYALEDAAEEGTLSQELLECVPTMALTLRSLERRLGVNSDEHIVIFAMCKGCGTRHSMAAVNNARFPGCPHILPSTGERCGYPVWEEKELYGGVKKRVPLKCFPVFPPEIALERLVERPGVPETMIRRPHGEEDDPPLTKQDWLNSTPLDQRFSDISQAWGWNSEPVKLKRWWNVEQRRYEDTLVEGQAQPAALANLPLGLSLAMNTDGHSGIVDIAQAASSWSLTTSHFIFATL
ncbi:hypothetical protein FRC09_001746 [Ceratobasidium sp. 395]|nr:hypothetical protein FRC09_001746 [Ceratobasidium sp. 395]